MRTVEERFWSKVAIGRPGECWPWTASLKSSGYGQFKLNAHASPQVSSRVAWLLTHGDPGSLLVLHRCDNPPCCNPAHLFLGSPQDNMTDMRRKGRQPAATEASYKALVESCRVLSDAEITDARRAVAGGESRRSVARRLDVAHTTIIRLINGEHWGGYPTAE